MLPLPHQQQGEQVATSREQFRHVGATKKSGPGALTNRERLLSSWS
jgi:hypothetical protein